MKALLTRGLTSLGLLRNLQRTFALTFSNSRSDHVSIMKTWEDDSSKIHFGGGGGRQFTELSGNYWKCMAVFVVWDKKIMALPSRYFSQHHLR